MNSVASPPNTSIQINVFDFALHRKQRFDLEQSDEETMKLVRLINTFR